MRGDAQTAYLFQCGDEELFAVSRQEYSQDQLHAGLAAAARVQARRGGSGTSGDRLQEHSSRHHRQGLLHLARGHLRYLRGPAAKARPMFEIRGRPSIYSQPRAATINDNRPHPYYCFASSKRKALHAIFAPEHPYAGARSGIHIQFRNRWSRRPRRRWQEPGQPRRPNVQSASSHSRHAEDSRPDTPVDDRAGRA